MLSDVVQPETTIYFILTHIDPDPVTQEDYTPPPP